MPIFINYLKMKTVRLLIPLVLLAITATAQTKPAAKAKQPVAKTTTTAKPAADIAAATGPLKVAGLPSDEFYHIFVLPHTDQAAPEGYGTTPANPILVGAYEADLSDQNHIKQVLNRFLKTYVYADGTQPFFVDRQTKMIDNVNYDIFRIAKNGSTDTTTLYTDQYKSGPLHPIKGLKFYSKENLVTELTPLIQQIIGYDATPDKYGNAAAKTLSIKIVSSIGRDIGLDYLMDADYIGPLVKDAGIDLDLKAFLVRSYIFHKLQYEVTGQPNPKVQAFNTMLDDYQATIRAHDIFAKGILPTLTKK